jgi:hypothetical protein
MRFGLVTGFICFTSSRKKLQSLKVTSAALNFALTLELEFLWDQLSQPTPGACLIFSGGR